MPKEELSPPPSVRFFGRRWFPAPLLTLVSAFDVGINEWRCEQVRRHFGVVVRESTWKRWRRWWREEFIKTSFWQQARGSVPPDITGPFPRTLLGLFKGHCEQRVSQLLKFLSPITAGILRAV